MEHEGRLVGRRRAFEETPQDGDDDVSPVEAGQRVLQLRGPFGRIELVAAFLESWGGLDVQVRPEGDHQDVGLVDALVGDDALALGVDGEHRLLTELDVGLGDVAVAQPDFVQAPPAEHHVELREAEDEGVALVDQGDPDLVPEPLGEPGRQLEAAEPGPEDQYP